MVDAGDSKSPALTGVPVRVRPWVPTLRNHCPHDPRRFVGQIGFVSICEMVRTFHRDWIGFGSSGFTNMAKKCSPVESRPSGGADPGRKINQGLNKICKLLEKHLFMRFTQRKAKAVSNPRVVEDVLVFVNEFAAPSGDTDKFRTNFAFLKTSIWYNGPAQLGGDVCRSRGRPHKTRITKDAGDVRTPLSLWQCSEHAKARRVVVAILATANRWLFSRPASEVRAGSQIRHVPGTVQVNGFCGPALRHRPAAA